MTFIADNSAANAVKRFNDGLDDKIVVDVTILYGVDTQAYAASGVTTSCTSRYFTTCVPRDSYLCETFLHPFTIDFFTFFRGLRNDCYGVDESQ
jgi:hypothetical protein